MFYFMYLLVLEEVPPSFPRAVGAVHFTVRSLIFQ